MFWPNTIFAIPKEQKTSLPCQVGPTTYKWRSYKPTFSMYEANESGGSSQDLQLVTKHA